MSPTTAFLEVREIRRRAGGYVLLAGTPERPEHPLCVIAEPRVASVWASRRPAP